MLQVTTFIHDDDDDDNDGNDDDNNNNEETAETRRLRSADNQPPVTIAPIANDYTGVIIASQTLYTRK